MKALTISIALILTTQILSGQYTFNNIYSAIGRPTSFNTVNVAPNHYVVSGGFLDTTGTNFLGLMACMFALDGNTIDINLFGSSEQEFLSIGHAYSYLNEQFIHQCTNAANDTMWSTIVWLNQSSDTLISRNYYSHHLGLGYDSDENIQTFYCTLNPDSTVYLANVVVGESTCNDAALQKLDKDGNTLWIYDHATASDPDMIFGIVPREDGVVYAAIEASTANTPTNHVIVKLNNNGEWQWQIETNDFLQGIGRTGTMIEDNDTLVVCGSYLDSSVGDFYPFAGIYKVDTLGNLIWVNQFGMLNDYVVQEFTNVVQTTDGNYVCGGTWKTVPGTEEIPEGYTNGDYDEFAYIVKFDRNDGSIIWDRKYRWLEVYRDNHTLRDMKATPDGGVIFCGEVKDFYMQQFEDFSQRGWVVKLDECGCLVPGCDTACTDIAVHEQNNILPIRVYPNPASEILNIHVGQFALGNHAELLLIDNTGKIIRSHNVPENNTTYMTSVAGLPVGSYVVQLVNDGGVIATGQVVVE